MRHDALKQALDTGLAPLVFTGQNRVLAQVKGERIVERKLSLTLILALVLVFALAVGAVAAALDGRVLSYLFGRSAPTEEQQQSVQAVGVTAECPAGRIHLTDCLYDGLRLSAGLTFDCPEPVFCWDMQVSSPAGPIWMDFASPLQSWNVNPVTGVPGEWDQVDHGFLAYLDEETIPAAAAMDTLPVTVTLPLMKPEKGIKSVDTQPVSDAPEYAAWQQQVDDWFAEGYTVVYASDTGHGQLYPSSCWQGAAVEDMPAYANLIPLEPVTLTFQVDTRKALAAVRDITPDHVDNDGRYAFTYQKILLSPLTTYFHFTVTPNEPFTTAQQLAEKMQWFEFYDEKSQPLAFAEGEYMGGAGMEEEPDGSLALVVEYPMPALTQLPEEGIYIVPRNHLEDGPLWEYAVYVPLR